MYTTMFVQDIGQHIWPRGSRGAASSISIELQPNNQGLEELLTKGLVRNGYGHSLTRSVEDFIENAATQVAEFDFAVFEISFTEDTKKKEITEVDCVWVNPLQIEFQRGKVVQVVHPAVASERGLETRIHLPDEALMVFRAPEHLRTKLKESREALSLVSDFRNLGFAVSAMENRTPFDWKSMSVQQCWLWRKRADHWLGEVAACLINTSRRHIGFGCFCFTRFS